MQYENIERGRTNIILPLLGVYKNPFCNSSLASSEVTKFSQVRQKFSEGKSLRDTTFRTFPPTGRPILAPQTYPLACPSLSAMMSEKARPFVP